MSYMENAKRAEDRTMIDVVRMRDTKVDMA
jgi:hypothetical protein